MGFGEAVKTCFGKYVDFSGRASRSEYWWFYLFYIIVAVIAGLIDGLLETQFVGLIVVLAMLLPILAVGVRRLHDIDRSGWWLLIGFVPVIGGIVLLVFACLPSKDPNRFGPAHNASEQTAEVFS